MDDPRVDSGSFRDRKARVFHRAGQVYRAIDRGALEDWRALQSTRFFARHRERGQIVDTVEVAPEELFGPGQDDWAAVLRHEKIPFVSYPYEWPMSMLKDAALLHLDLLLEALDEDMILKDSSAFNIQWRGSSPVFIDIPSFERMEPGDAWAGYRQFCEMFLYPLFLRAYKGVSHIPWLRGSLDGIDASACRALMSLRDYLRPGVLKHVYLQATMESRYADVERDFRHELKGAGFSSDLITNNVRQLRKLVSGLQPPRPQSEWSDYVDTGHYGPEDQERKERFVRDAVSARPRELVWDLGCNTGLYSRIAAETADYVVALDADEMSVEHLYRGLVDERCDNVLPLVGDLADPSPDCGWRARERRTLWGRQRPDLVLCLALLHHMVISANIPLREFVGWLAELGGDLVIEFVTRGDPMVDKLLRNKDDIYDDYGREQFEACLGEGFDIVRQTELMEGRRVIYSAQNKQREAVARRSTDHTNDADDVPARR